MCAAATVNIIIINYKNEMSQKQNACRSTKVLSLLFSLLLYANVCYSVFFSCGTFSSMFARLFTFIIFNSMFFPFKHTKAISTRCNCLQFLTLFRFFFQIFISANWVRHTSFAQSLFMSAKFRGKIAENLLLFARICNACPEK